MKKLLKNLCIAGGVLCAVKGLDNRLEITYHTITSPALPENFDGFRIVQLSDFHCDSIAGLSQEVKILKPDIIVFTGDMVHDTGSYTPIIALTESLVKIAPVYMVTGNHDLWRNDFNTIEQELKDLGAVFLHNERVTIKIGDERIALTGIDDPFTRESKKVSQKIENALKSVASWEGYDILLFHRANLLDQLKDCGFDLILSGHMHGGQIRIPGKGGLVSPKSSFGSGTPMFFPKYFGGRYKHKNTDMIVSRGLGNPMIIPRIFNRPELVVAELHCIHPSAKAHA